MSYEYRPDEEKVYYTLYTLDGEKEDGQVVSAKKIFGQIENEIFVQKLRQDGFVELNGYIFKKYIDAFLDLCDVKNKKQVYVNVNQLLTNNKINLVLKKFK